MEHMVAINGCYGRQISVGTGSDNEHVTGLKIDSDKKSAKAWLKSYNQRLFSVLLAGWLCYVSQR
jgi:hypothetical protein